MRRGKTKRIAMRVVLKDVARLSDVSVSTASMALNNKLGISEETRRKVLEIAQRCNYRPNETAKSLVIRKSNLIGLIVTDIRNPFFSVLVDRFNMEAECLGYNLLLGITSDRIANEKKYVEMFVSKNVEGVIVVPTIETAPNVSHLRSLKRLGIPFVFCTTAYPGISETCVMTDLMIGEYMLVRHLLDRGLRRIHIIAGSRKVLISKLRLEGYRRAFAEADVDYDERWIVETTPDFEHGYEAARNIINDRPDAIVTINDFLAMGVLRALKERGVRVPEDVSVAGYDDLLFSSITETPLTTVRQPIDDICRRSLDLLRAKIAGRNGKPELVFLEPMLTIRESTR
jgi:LacI family transcriptional regulator